MRRHSDFGPETLFFLWSPWKLAKCSTARKAAPRGFQPRYDIIHAAHRSKHRATTRLRIGFSTFYAKRDANFVCSGLRICAFEMVWNMRLFCASLSFKVSSRARGGRSLRQPTFICWSCICTPGTRIHTIIGRFRGTLTMVSLVVAVANGLREPGNDILLQSSRIPLTAGRTLMSPQPPQRRPLNTW